MRDDVDLFAPPTPEELAEAARLRERLENGCGAPGADAEKTLALFAAISDTGSRAAVLDEVTVRRLRRELVGEASWRRSRSALRAVMQIAAALLIGALLVGPRAPVTPSATLLTEREALALEAVTQAQASKTNETLDVPASTLASMTRSRNAELFLKIDSEWLSSRVQASSSGSAGSSGSGGAS